MPMAEDIGEPKGVGRHPTEQGARLGCGPGACEHVGGHRGEHPESGEQHRMDGYVQHRAQEVLGDAAESFGQCAEDPAPPGPVGPEFRGGVVHGSVGRATTSAVERVGVLHLGPRPGQPVFREVVLPAEGCVHGQRVEACIFYAEHDAYPEWLNALR